MRPLTSFRPTSAVHYSAVDCEVNPGTTIRGLLSSGDLPPGAVGGPFLLALDEILLACEEDEAGFWRSQNGGRGFLKVEMKGVNSFGPIGAQMAPAPAFGSTNHALSFKISTLIGAPATNRWTRHVRPALDFYEQNVEIVRSKDGYCLKTTKAVADSQQLFAWFGKELAAEIGLSFLSRANIKDMNTYKCHVCSRQFRRPNPLKSHILLRHSRFEQARTNSQSQSPVHDLLRFRFQDSFDLGHTLQSVPRQHFQRSRDHFLPPAFHNQPEFNSANVNLPERRWTNGASPYFPHPTQRAFKSPRSHPLTDIVSFYSRGCSFNPSQGFASHVHLPAAWKNQPRTVESQEKLTIFEESQAGREPKPGLSPKSSDVKSSEVSPSSRDAEESRPSEAESERSDHPKFRYRDGPRTRLGYVCPYCGKLYSRKYGLKIHVRTHTGFKPLKCKICQRPFGDPSNLNKHVRLHAEGDTPYRCDRCGKVLVRRRDLERHVKSRHSEDACRPDRVEGSPETESSAAAATSAEENQHQQQTVSSSAEFEEDLDLDV